MSGRVVTLGETMGLFRATGLGSLAQVSDFHLGIGGAESNVAVALARLGASVTWLGRVGADGLGDRIVRELRGEGIDVRAVRDEQAPTGMMIKEQRTSTATRVLYYRSGSAGSRIDPADVAAGRYLLGGAAARQRNHSGALRECRRRHRGRRRRGGLRGGSGVVRREPSRIALGRPRSRAACTAHWRRGRRSCLPATTKLASSFRMPRPPRISRRASPRSVPQRWSSSSDRPDASHSPMAWRTAVRPSPSRRSTPSGLATHSSPATSRSGCSASRSTTGSRRRSRTGAFACLNPGDWEGFPRRDELALLGAAEPVTR